MKSDNAVLRNMQIADWLILCVLPIPIIMLCLYFQSAMPDDSFIYLRVAENIGNGDGWLYNKGQIANPSTSIFYSVLLVIIGLVTGFSQNTLVTAYALGMIVLAAVQYFAWRKEGRFVALAMVVISVGAVRVLDCIGMETSVFLACISATALSFRNTGNSILTGVLAGLTALSRPEGIAIVCLLLIFFFFDNRSIAWRILIGSMIIMAPWLIYSAIVFHTPLPGSVAVKGNMANLGWWKEQPSFIVSYFFQSGLVGEVKHTGLLYLILALVSTGAGVAWQRFRDGDPYLAVCFSFGVVQLAGYHVLQAPAGFRWYYAAGNFALDMAVAVASLSLARFFSQYFLAGMARRREAIVSSFASILLIAVMGYVSIAGWGLPELPYRLSDSYRSAGKWLKQNSKAGDSVAMTEIGYLGFFSGLEVVDVHGLIHPEAISDLRAERMFWWYERKRPSFIVIHQDVWKGEPGSADWPEVLNDDFQAHYHPVFEEKALRIFALNELN
jgi:arabinofuranosyltransferase